VVFVLFPFVDFVQKQYICFVYEITINGQKYSVETDLNSAFFQVKNASFETKIVALKEREYSVSSKRRKTKIYIIDVDFFKKKLTVLVNGSTYVVSVKDANDLLLEKMGLSLKSSSVEKELKAPMPGLVIDVLVKEGQSVSKKSSLLILEAMKMENVLKSNFDVRVKKILVRKGEKVDKNQPLILFE